jgi:hypothetical protein
LEAYNKKISEQPRTGAIIESTGHERMSKRRSAGTNYTISLWKQVVLLSSRQYKLQWGDKPSLMAKIGGSIFQSIIVGSIFYDQQPITASGFTWAGGELRASSNVDMVRSTS